jgi:hypothetical protein
MTRVLHEFVGRVSDAQGRDKSVRVQILAPVRTGEDDEAVCVIHAPDLQDTDKQIYGVDDVQAVELALRFTRSWLEGKGFIEGKAS